MNTSTLSLTSLDITLRADKAADSVALTDGAAGAACTFGLTVLSRTSSGGHGF